MKVVKIGGGCLKGKKNIAHILDLIAERGRENVFVVSALNGITDILVSGMNEALEDEANIPRIMNRLKNRHALIARHLIKPGEHLRKFATDFDKSSRELERLYYGLNFTREITPRLRDVIGSFGERFCVKLLVGALRERGIQTAYRMPHTVGLVTDGKFGDATANIRKTGENLKQHIIPLLKEGMCVFMPGFFGVSESGDITTFGRGGSDYSAAVVAVALEADILEIWKDTEGYLSADPRFVPDAKLIPVLSYDEAAELSYFGAKILHPRTVEPIRKTNLNIAIKNTLNPDGPGSLITARSAKAETVVKSVACETDIAVLKVHGSAVGARPGILGHVANQLSQRGINIKSAVTSQTCISLLLSLSDLEPGYRALRVLKPKPYRRLERVGDVAMVSIVGEGLGQHRGVAARCFTAVAECGVNVEMISFGPSPVALYFLVSSRELKKAVAAIHQTIFSDSRK
jgi:aspartate kinase